MYKYYVLKRPIDMGTVPIDFIYSKNYGKKEKVNGTNIEAWGEVYYDRRLSQYEIRKFEMKEELPQEEKEKVIQDIKKLDEIYLKLIKFNPNNEELNKQLKMVENYIYKTIISMLNKNLIPYEEYKEATLKNEEDEEIL